MFNNYIRITLRNIKKHKGYSFINITGLALGMACCILIFLWAQNELSYDRFHKNINELCRIIRYESSPDGTLNQFASTSRPVGPSFRDSYPEIVEFTRFYNLYSLKDNILLEYKNKKFYEKRFGFAGPAFFSIFTFPFIKGDPQSALTQPNSIVITQEMAEKYFGEENPIGKTLNMSDWGDFTVSGVIRNIPANSHLKFDFISPIGPLFERFKWMRGWRIPHFFTYVKLDKRADINQLNEKIRYHMKEVDPENYKLTFKQYSLQPVKDIHLYSNFKSDLQGESGLKSVYITFFSAIAAFVLIIACINFINLTTARSTIRAREIGVRKVYGANRSNIARQFFGESLLMSFLSFGLAIILVVISLPICNRLSENQMYVGDLFKLDIFPGIVGIAIITGILSGFYPALVLSSFQPVNTMKRTRANGKQRKLFRQVLVIMQFSLSLILLIGTVIVYNQLEYIQNKRLGFNKEYLFYFAKQGSLISQYDAFKNALLKNTNILGVTTSSDLPTETTHYTVVKGWEGSSSKDGMMMNFFSVDEDYDETFGIKMAEGRFFSESFSTDATEGYVVNEEAVKLMGMQNPIGKRFVLFGRVGRIIGVMKNFHFRSLHQQIEPLIFWIRPSWDRYIFVRINPERITETINFLKGAHQKLNPRYPFDFKFLDSDIDQLYKTEIRTKQILQLFTGFAIFISCIGLFGLAAFIISLRTKETGIRKVLGASVSSVVMLLSRDFMKWILLANLVGWPVAFIVMNKWLQTFAYRIDFSIWMFLLPGFLLFFIALLTVSFNTIRTARSNPVHSLRYE
jgi:ABC-type antimicrobial peptide transport system permease subunit